MGTNAVYDASSLSAAVDREELFLPILRFFVPSIGSCRLKKMTGVGVKNTLRTFIAGIDYVLDDQLSLTILV